MRRSSREVWRTMTSAVADPVAIDASLFDKKLLAEAGTSGQNLQLSPCIERTPDTDESYSGSHKKEKTSAHIHLPTRLVVAIRLPLCLDVTLTSRPASRNPLLDRCEFLKRELRAHCLLGVGGDCVAFACPNVVALFDRQDENPTVTDLPGSCADDDRLDRRIHLVFGKYDFNHDFWKKRHAIFRATINRFVASLPAVASDFGNRQAVDVQDRERVLNRFEFGGSNDRFD